MPTNFYGKPSYPPAGTLLSTYCSGYDLWGVYANGSGGTYNQVIQYNSPSCGYVPVYNETVSGPTDVAPFSSFNIQITGGVPYSTVTETQGGLGTITLNGAGAGTFNAFISAPIYYYYSFSFDGTGHVRTLSVAGIYTYDLGFSQEYMDQRISAVRKMLEI
jgi:hypothetical protein